MSKRTQSIRNLFVGVPEEPRSQEAKQPVQRVASGAVRSLQDTFSEVERNYDELRRQVEAGAALVEIDPHLIDPSPFADRFPDQDTEAVETLKTSLLEHGQEVPVLLRIHPSVLGRYQTVYGHRRVRAALDLGLKVKAYVKDLADDRLAVAQGVENSARQDLTFIERAMFALKLQEAGLKRSLIQTALSVDRQEVHKLLSVAQGVPKWAVEYIGRAPKVGRPRWQKLSQTMSLPEAQKNVWEFIHSGTRSNNSDDRFTAVIRAAKGLPPASVARLPKGHRPQVATSFEGDEIAWLHLTTRECRIDFDLYESQDFAKFLMAQIPELYSKFKCMGEKTEDR